MHRRVCTVAVLAAALSGTASSGTACGPSPPATATQSRASAEASWKLEIDGTALVLERMDVHLVEDESEPEVLGHHRAGHRGDRQPGERFAGPSLSTPSAGADIRQLTSQLGPTSVSWG